MRAGTRAVRLSLKIWRWHDAVYDVRVFLLHGTGVQAVAWIKKTFDDDDDLGKWTGAKTLWMQHVKGTALVLWFPEWFHVNESHYLGVLAHETQHGTVFTLRGRGLIYTPESEEAFAYHQAWLFRECHRRLKTRKIA